MVEHEGEGGALPLREGGGDAEGRALREGDGEALPAGEGDGGADAAVEALPNGAPLPVGAPAREVPEVVPSADTAVEIQSRAPVEAFILATKPAVSEVFRPLGTMYW